MFKIIKTSVVLLLVVSISACSYSPSLLKEMYQEFPQEVFESLQEAIDLTPSQSAGVDDYVNQVMHWHRRHKLPVYSQSLADLASHVQYGTANEQAIVNFFKIVDDIPHFNEAKHLTHKMASVAFSLNTSQVSQLKQYLKREHAEEVSEIRKESISVIESKDTQALFKFLNINLSYEQMTLVKRETKKLHDLRWKELEGDKLKDRQLIALLRTKNNSDFTSHFSQLWDSDDELPTAALRVKEKQNNRILSAMLSKLIVSFSSQQQSQLSTQLFSMSKTFGEMSNE